MIDGFSREISYMRISITGECDLNCLYCNPNADCSLSEHDKGASARLSPLEISEICRAALCCGISSFRITGGEPLLRADCEEIIRRIISLEGVKKVTLTTNGIHLPERIASLKDSGLKGINISLDSLNENTYERITGRPGLKQVLRGIDLCLEAGIPVKINSVLMSGINHDEFAALSSLAEEKPLDLRFIEIMPIGYGKAFKVVENKTVLQRLKEIYPDLAPDESSADSGCGPAVCYRSSRLLGRIGFINPIGEKFCHRCNRIRLTSDGSLKPCLCFSSTQNIRALFNISSDSERQDQLINAIKAAIASKPEGHCFDKNDGITENRKMYEIGG